jgi:hypothetical protein
MVQKLIKKNLKKKLKKKKKKREKLRKKRKERWYGYLICEVIFLGNCFKREALIFK